jgi:hypothetical protein
MIDLAAAATYSMGTRRSEGPHMSEFDERERAQEKKFEIDQQLEFRAHARRNKLLGHWAAAQLGLAGAEADAFTTSIVNADMEEAGDDDVFRAVRKAFDAKGVSQSDHQIRARMAELLATVRAELKTGG